MTAEQMMRDYLWEMLGEPTDLDPVGPDGVTIDQNSSGYRKMLGALNLGINAVAAYKDGRSGRQFRWRGRQAWQYVSLTPVTAALQADVDKGSRQLTFGTGAGAEYLVQLGTEVRVITQVAGATYTVDRGFDRAYDAGAKVIYCPRYLQLSLDNTKFIELLTIYDQQTSRELLRSTRNDVFARGFASDPARYYRVGDRVYLDSVRLDEARQYRVDYLRLPPDMVLPTNNTGLPIAFDWAVILWAAAWGFARILDPQQRAAYRAEFVNEMRSKQNEFDVEAEHNPLVGGYLRRP